MDSLVSTIITCFNSNERYLYEAIQSVINQSYDNIEIIIVDDGSKNDACRNICKVFSDRVKYIYQENKGLPGARNTGIVNSSGEFICFLDDDDRWHKDKVYKEIERFKEVENYDSNIGMTFTYCNVISEEDKFITKYGYKVSGNIYEKILYGNIIGAPSSVMIKREVLLNVGLFNEQYRYAEDIELWYRITKNYSVYSTDDYLIDYRWRANSLSKNLEKMDKYCEMSLLQTLKLEKNDGILSQKNEILANYYINVAHQYFIVGNTVMFRQRFYNVLNNRFRDIFRNKLIIKFLFSLFGENFVRWFNHNRGSEKFSLLNGVQDHSSRRN